MPSRTDDVSSAHSDSNSSSDDDFNPTVAAISDSEASTSSSSSSEAPSTQKPTAKGRKRKRKAPAPTAQPLDLDSGDEATISAARQRKTKKRKYEKGVANREDEDADVSMSEDEGEEGRLIKTRAQRRVEQETRRPLAGIEGATVDVDALWAQMKNAPLRAVPVVTEQKVGAENQGAAVDRNVTERDERDLVAIRKIYTFAGQRTTEEKQVPRSALEGYQADGWKLVTGDATAAAAAATTLDDKSDAPPTDPKPSSSKNDKPQTRRPLRRPSRFDPNPTGYVRALPPEHQLTFPRKQQTTGVAGQENIAEPAPAEPAPRPEKAQKLNVVDKSRLDWSGFVAKEGIAEELDVHGKTKEAYLGRMAFLQEVEGRREESRKKMKMKAVGAG
ncbi:BCNT-domain-containing protein [Sporormia fimetaria CBS 119925]|uniref:SWR1-complex protein 5 n=1 Tax=Sporormia fimetaria CBS 119925 TaxID=1340428 RepID=A0A6A6V3U5_9PLEO|nr:BCNT-domain-containing protein [Sporormia fimetaria CBS 119925]